MGSGECADVPSAVYRGMLACEAYHAVRGPQVRQRGRVYYASCGCCGYTPPLVSLWPLSMHRHAILRASGRLLGPPPPWPPSRVGALSKAPTPREARAPRDPNSNELSGLAAPICLPSIIFSSGVQGNVTAARLWCVLRRSHADHFRSHHGQLRRPSCAVPPTQWGAPPPHEGRMCRRARLVSFTDAGTTQNGFLFRLRHAADAAGVKNTHAQAGSQVEHLVTPAKGSERVAP